MRFSGYAYSIRHFAFQRFVLLCLFALAFPNSILADTSSEGWSWSVGCDGEGTFGSSLFTASNAAGFTGNGTCSRTSTYFTKFTFTSSSGALQTSTLYALHTGDVLIVPPTLGTDVEPIFTAQPNCPTYNQTLNWILVQWDTSSNQLTNTYLLGTATYNTTSGITVTGQYDVSGAGYWLGAVPMAGSCSGGIYSSSGVSSDLNGTVYFTTTGAGVYKTNPGHATFFFPQYLTNTSTDLGGQSAPGISFDSTTATHTRQVLVTTDVTGTVYTVQPYSDPNAGTMDSSYTDIITITQTNAPQPGMLIGNVIRTGAGAGSGKLACIVNKDFDFRISCTGQSPSNNQFPYTTTFVIENLCPSGYIRVPKNPAVGTNDDFCIAKYEMSNDAGAATSSMTGTPWTNISRGNGVSGDGGAITACQALGPGYDLVSNDEWQTVAREIETAYSATSGYLNWSNGYNTGSNFLNLGNSALDGVRYCGGTPAECAAEDAFAGLPADVDTNPCSGITGHPNCANNSSGDWAYKRTSQLSNGNIIWDFGGNDSTWVKDNNSATQGSNGWASSVPWNTGGQSKWGPAGTNYSGMSSSPYGGLGYQTLNSSSGAIRRGCDWGYFCSPGNAGAFSVDLSANASTTSASTGFRCTWHVPAPNVISPTVGTITSTGITLSWSSSGGTTDGYQIAYVTGSTPPANCYSGSVIGASTIDDTTTVTISSLSPSTTYSFLVCSLSEAGGLSSGVSLTATTSAGITYCSSDSGCTGGAYCDNDGNNDNQGTCTNSGLHGADNRSGTCNSDTDCEYGYQCVSGGDLCRVCNHGQHQRGKRALCYSHHSQRLVGLCD